MEKDELFEHLKNSSKVLEKPELKKAFMVIDRADFLSDDYKFEAYEDYAVPIHKGENITKPSVATFMIELLDVVAGNRVLEVGSGSGYTCALLAEIVGKDGKVIGVERHPELVEESKKNLQKYSYKNIEIRKAGEKLGLPDELPFERILVTASAGDVLPELVSQLALGGVMVMVVDDAIVQVKKKGKAVTETKYYPGFMFDELGV